MEKINIAELLKDCPKGMELYSPVFGKVYLDRIRPHLAIVVTTDKEQGNFKEEFLYDGRYGMNGECMLFPSKDKTTWEGFVPPCQFNEGDVVVSNYGDIHLLRTKDSSYCAYRERWNNKFDPLITTSIKVVRLATEEEKQKLFKAIKDNGFKWNPGTKTLEKVIEPKFNVGDKVRPKNQHEVRLISEVWNNYYLFDEKNIPLPFSAQDDWELVPNKFDINTLVPFESRVLVRDSDMGIWLPEFFGCLCDGNDCPYMIVGGTRWKCCIPYEGNEYLLGKIGHCDEYYKTWED